MSVLIDSNILMYAAGADHVNKRPCVALLDRVVRGGVGACLSTEILQEICHRYRAIGRWYDGRNLFRLACDIITDVLPIDLPLMVKSYELLERYPSLMARDGLHAATCLVHTLDGICSFDRDFDVIDGLRRFLPDDLA